MGTRLGCGAIDQNRRQFLSIAASGIAFAGAAGVLPVPPAQAASDATSDAISPFRINVPDDALVDLRHRLAASRWPDGRG